MSADSPVDLIIDRRYRCFIDPLHDNSQRDGVGVYPATTIRVPKPLMVKLSADDSMLQEFAVLDHLHTRHPAKAKQFIVNVEDFVEAKAGEHGHAIFMEKGDINLGAHCPPALPVPIPVLIGGGVAALVVLVCVWRRCRKRAKKAAALKTVKEVSFEMGTARAQVSDVTPKHLTMSDGI